MLLKLTRRISCRKPLCPPGKPHRTFTHTWQNTTAYLKETIDTLMSDSRQTVDLCGRLRTVLILSCTAVGQLVLPHRIPRLASIIVGGRDGKD